MKGLLPLWAVAALLPSASVASQHGRTYLASIVGIEIGEHEYIDRFAIETWGVEILAVCHIPPGWRIRAGQSATPEGDIEGEASHGVTFLSREQLSALEGLVLIEVDGDIGGSEIDTIEGDRLPANFTGSAAIGTYGDGPDRMIILGPENVRLRPANACPAPSR